jgi:hypothetical protein
LSGNSYFGGDVELAGNSKELFFNRRSFKRPFCESEYPPGSVAKSWGRVANLHGLDVVRYTARELTPGLVKAALEHLPGKIAETGVNSLILDTLYRLLEIVPMHLRFACLLCFFRLAR